MFIRALMRQAAQQEKTFAQLFRESKFVQLGPLNGQTVPGRVVHRVGDDLYIDFGMKFNCVCKRPQRNAERYVTGARVLVKLYDTELSERFLGSRNDLTLLEADAELVGLLGKERRERKDDDV